MIRSTREKTLTTVVPRDIPKLKEKIKAKLPTLKATDVRRYKIPHNETVILELQEEGYYEAAEYLKFLFDLDEEMRINAGPDTIIWNKPRLRDNRELIDKLRKILIIFSQREISACKRTKALIGMALYFQNLTWEWWWIADTLYRTAFWIAKEIEDNEEILNILRYIYARFLFDKMKKEKLALEYVREAQRNSRGKAWNASRILNAKQESLFRECCTLLNEVLLSIAREVRHCEVEVAINSCKIAVSAATEAGHEDQLAEAYCELGKNELTADNVSEALKHFSKSLYVLEKISDPRGCCKIYAELIHAYKKIGNDEKVLENLQKFKKVASEFQLLHELAEAYYLTGEYYLTRSNFKEATPNLESSFSIYNTLGIREEINRARCLIGVSKGQEIMEAYQVLIMQSAEGDVDATLRICNWRDRGETFYDVPMNAKNDIFKKSEK